MAEGEGFEPPEPFRVQWFSRPPPSTTRPSLRVEIGPEFARLPDRRRTNRLCVTRSVTVTEIRRRPKQFDLAIDGSVSVDKLIGMPRDGRGKRVYLSDAVVIMTSNLGAENFRKLTSPMGFLSKTVGVSQVEGKVRRELERRFCAGVSQPHR